MFEWIGQKISNAFETLGSTAKKGWELVGGHLNSGVKQLNSFASVAEKVAGATGFDTFAGMARDLQDFTNDASLNLQQVDEAVNRLEKRTQHTSSQIKEKTSQASKHIGRFRKHLGM